MKRRCLSLPRSLLAILLGFASVAFADSPPNVILILADDLAIGDLSCFNNGLSRTPRLDRLRTESVYFQNAYAGSAVCAPSRASLLTGRYPHRTGAVTLNQRKFPEMTRIHLDELTIADRFSEHGYATGLIGKWHSGNGPDYHPLQRGFDEFIGFNESWDVKTYFKYRLDVQGHYRSFDGPYLTDLLTEKAINFVRKHQSHPFFLHLAHYAPHRPLSAPQTLVDAYREEGLPEKTAQVYAMIEVMDRGIGELLDELDHLNLAEKTVVLFASDNGPDPLVDARFNLDCRGTKYMINEGGIRVPLMMRWQGNIRPSESNELVHFTDVVPTLMDLCGLKAAPQALPLDGGSFVDALKSAIPTKMRPQQRFWQWNRGRPMYSHNAAVREGEWKLVRPFVTRNIPTAESKLPPRLYNLSSDPGETIDLANQYPFRVERMLSDLTRWSVEVERDRVQEK